DGVHILYVSLSQISTRHDVFMCSARARLWPRITSLPRLDKGEPYLIRRGPRPNVIRLGEFLPWDDDGGRGCSHWKSLDGEQCGQVLHIQHEASGGGDIRVSETSRGESDH